MFHLKFVISVAQFTVAQLACRPDDCRPLVLEYGYGPPTFKKDVLQRRSTTTARLRDLRRPSLTQILGSTPVAPRLYNTPPVATYVPDLLRPIVTS